MPTVVIDEVFHDAEPVERGGDGFLRRQRLIFVHACLRRVVGIGVLVGEGERRDGLQPLQIAVHVELHLHIERGDERRDLGFQHRIRLADSEQGDE